MHSYITFETIASLQTGPVRGVAFHPFRDLLVTGGDDYKVRVWGTCRLHGLEERSCQGLADLLWRACPHRHESAESEVSVYSAWPSRLRQIYPVPSRDAVDCELPF